ncbi:MAG: glycosyltransferase [Candidatus Kaiserbacteria bacterium]|nr:glycosyltransferase [Candidatus Kaiserbacteria bacterium]
MKSNDFPLSVILLTHNQSDILSVQMAALEHQEDVRATEFEVIVTDDSSRVEELKKIERILDKTNLSCRLVRQMFDRFWAARARNNAINASKGRLLLFLDGDMIPEVDLLSRHLLAHMGRTNHVVAGNRLRRRFGFQGNDFDQILELCRNSSSSDPDIIRWQQGEERKRGKFIQSANPWRAVFGCHFSVNAAPEVIFDESFKGWGPEDAEFAYRLARHHGYSVEYAPDIKAYEVDNLGQGVANVFRLRTQQAIVDYLRNTIYFFDKCPCQRLEDVFQGFRKLKLRDGEWFITPADKECDLKQCMAQARDWLVVNGHL